MQVSVIIPIHNVAAYLPRCLDSILNQTFPLTNLEILLIDNNSTDNSPEVIKQYHQKYPSLIYAYTCTTKGASAARNLGAKHAKGKYLWFIDSDDYIASTAISDLFTAAEKTGADLTTFKTKRIYRNGRHSYLPALDPTAPDFKSRFVRYGFGPWHFLIRRAFWQKHNITFKEGIIHEDMELMSSLILHTDKIASVDKILYYYLENPNSVLHQNTWNPHALDIFPALISLYQKFTDADATQKYHDELEYFFIWNLLLDAANDFSKFKEGRANFSKIRQTMHKYFPHWRKNRFLHQKSLLLRLRCRLNYYGLVLHLRAS